MADDDDKRLLVCAPVGGASQFLPNTDVIQCSKCGQGMWIAPSGKKVMAEDPEMKAICLDCALPHLLENPDAKVQPITEEQVQEILDLIKKLK